MKEVDVFEEGSGLNKDRESNKKVIKYEGLSDDDEELQEARNKLRQFTQRNCRFEAVGRDKNATNNNKQTEEDRNKPVVDAGNDTD
ncbi:conserved hypothetical protein [Ricinus communis]|uniref:Uncharacterized protein n=1 Tax=Ricinus communis TaxID=3988 RepID=B9SN42_RICCO|nr:conserved hypothetical protein [Ricinus communis]